MEERQLDLNLPLLSVKHNRQQSLPSSKSIDEHEVRKSATVPFHWEQIPGKPKQVVEIPVRTPEGPSNIQTESLRAPPGRESGPFIDHNLLHLNCEYESDSEGDDDRYSVDEQSRDFTMDRFLPAAKAVVLKTTDYVVEKPSVVNEYCNEYKDNVGSPEERRTSVPVKKSGKSWGIISRFCDKNYLCLLHKLPGMRWKLHSSKRNANCGPLDEDLPQMEQKLILDESPLKSPILDGFYEKFQNHNDNSIAVSRKLFESLQDVPRNGVNVPRFGRMDDAVEGTFYMDFLSKSDIRSVDQESDYQRQFDPCYLIPPLPKSPSESWLWRTILRTSNLEGLIPDAFDEQHKSWEKRNPCESLGDMIQQAK